MERCPKLCHVLTNIVNTGKSQLYSKEDTLSLSHRAKNAICLAAASCFKQYNEKLSAAHYRMGLLMLNGGAKAVTIDRCSRQGLTVSHTASIRMQTKAGQASAQCYSWKQDTLLKEQQIRFLEEVLKNAGDGAQLDMSRDTVSSLKCFEEESYDELLAFVQGVR